ncbi:hypothetical protein PDENDC454_23968 [Paenibacillus dendritiformis C454]|uniref:Uncharacterized protein n=1 Tax=Paenibacillus dendritiformis C454 TaxID=1131935 RepID=H3SMK0_9BACL|nr:hypothetical protein PDENDC454_23968 [Paenibacillus dendritiformis C454]
MQEVAIKVFHPPIAPYRVREGPAKSAVCALMLVIPMTQEVAIKVSTHLLPRIAVVKDLQSQLSMLLCSISQ